MTIEAFGERPT
ncbi:unnamed protein product, partial [Rotaria sp. Silwood1]